MELVNRFYVWTVDTSAISGDNCLDTRVTSDNNYLDTTMTTNDNCLDIRVTLDDNCQDTTMRSDGNCQEIRLTSDNNLMSFSLFWGSIAHDSIFCNKILLQNKFKLWGSSFSWQLLLKCSDKARIGQRCIGDVDDGSGGYKVEHRVVSYKELIAGNICEEKFCHY